MITNQQKKIAIGLGSAVASLSAITPMLMATDSASAAPTTFTGDIYNNPRGGQVEVAITVDGGKITAVTTPISPGGGNSQFTSYAVPILTQEALAAQSAHIQAVSGASQVSAAWISSLASAIAKAGTALTGATASPAPATTAPSTTPTTQATTAPAPLATPTLGGSYGQPRGEGGDDGRYYGGSGQSQNSLGNLQQQVNAYIAKVNAYAKQIVDNAKAQAAAIIAKAQAQAAAIATPTASASATGTATPNLVLTPGSGVIMKSLVCTKISLNPSAKKVTKVVRGLNPSCPKGYK